MRSYWGLPETVFCTMFSARFLKFIAAIIGGDKSTTPLQSPPRTPLLHLRSAVWDALYAPAPCSSDRPRPMAAIRTYPVPPSSNTCKMCCNLPNKDIFRKGRALSLRTVRNWSFRNRFRGFSEQSEYRQTMSLICVIVLIILMFRQYRRH